MDTEAFLAISRAGLPKILNNCFNRLSGTHPHLPPSLISASSSVTSNPVPGAEFETRLFESMEASPK